MVETRLQQQQHGSDRIFQAQERRSPLLDRDGPTYEHDRPGEARPSSLLNAVSTKFQESGEGVARLLEQMGDTAENNGKQRKDEFYRAAQNVRDKTSEEAQLATSHVQMLENIRDTINSNAERTTISNRDRAR